MLRDDGSDGGGRRRSPRNVLGEPLDICSIKPMTGFYQDGCCNTGREDVGCHTICVVMTSAFLEFSKSRGNDLSTAVPEFGFPGLKPGRKRAEAAIPCHFVGLARWVRNDRAQGAALMQPVRRVCNGIG